jgi:hypothetical protein
MGCERWTRPTLSTNTPPTHAFFCRWLIAPKRLQFLGHLGNLLAQVVALFPDERCLELQWGICVEPKSRADAGEFGFEHLDS